MPSKAAKDSDRPTVSEADKRTVANEVAIDAGDQAVSQPSDTPAEPRISQKLHAMELQATAIRENQLTLNAQPRQSHDLERRLDALEMQLATVNENQRTLIALQLSANAAVIDLPPAPEVDPCKCKKRAPSCCVEVFISGLQFLFNSDGNAEIIVAIQAGGTWGILPSLTSYVLLDKGVTAIIPFHTVIARMCIDCSSCHEIPLKANVLEVAGGIGEGRPESGAADGSIMVSCACPEAKAFLTVPFAKHKAGDQAGKVRGMVGVEVSTRAYPDGCC